MQTVVDTIVEEVNPVNDTTQILTKLNSIELEVKSFRPELNKLRQDVDLLMEARTSKTAQVVSEVSGPITSTLGLINVSANTVIDSLSGLLKGVVGVITLCGGRKRII